MGGDEGKPTPFFQRARLVVLDKRKVAIKRPETKITLDDSRLMILRLAREGFGGGDPERIENMPSDIVIDAIEYSNFLSDYEETVMEINKSTK